MHVLIARIVISKVLIARMANVNRRNGECQPTSHRSIIELKLTQWKLCSGGQPYQIERQMASESA